MMIKRGSALEQGWARILVLRMAMRERTVVVSGVEKDDEGSASTRRLFCFASGGEQATKTAG